MVVKIMIDLFQSNVKSNNVIITNHIKVYYL